MSATGTLLKATNGFCLELNWTTGKPTVVNGSYGSTGASQLSPMLTVKIECQA